MKKNIQKASKATLGKTLINVLGNVAGGAVLANAFYVCRTTDFPGTAFFISGNG